MNVTPVNPHQLVALWPELEPLLAMPLLRDELDNTMTLDQLRAELMESKAQCWVGWTDQEGAVGVAVTRILQKADGRRICDFITCGMSEGHAPDWNELLVPVETWAKETESCQEIWVTGRIGWQKALKASGFKPASVMLTKKI